MSRRKRSWSGFFADMFGLAVLGAVFVVPFLFILINSFKERREAGLMQFRLPKNWMGRENYLTVLENNDHELIKGFLNSAILSVAVILILVVICSMAGYILQRRQERISRAMQMLILIGLMLPPSILPTISGF